MAEEYLLAQPAAITIRAEDADRLLKLADGGAALLYLYILRNGGRLDREKAARELRLTAPVPSLISALREAGLLREESGRLPPEPPVREELPERTAEEVRERAAADPKFSHLLAWTSDRLGRMFGGGDMKILFGIYHDLGLPAEVIKVMVNYCIEDVQRRYGMGRKPTIRQVEKAAYLWEREGIFDLDAAERWIKSRTVRNARVEKLCEALGIRNRRLAATEERCLQHWLDMGFGEDAVLLAYDRTVAKKGELHWNYMNRILESWQGKGLHTPEEIRAGDLPPGRSAGRSAGKSGEKAAGPTAEEFERMQRLLNKMNGGGENGT